MDPGLKLSLRYLKNLGLLRGMILFMKVEIFKLSHFRISSDESPIYLRAGTTDVKVFREVFLFGTYSINASVSPKTIVDAGANIGLSSVYFAKKYPEATIYAIEPERSNFMQLQKNTAPYSNIIPIQSALWGIDTPLRVTDINENHWAFTVQECDESHPESVRGLSITTLIDQHRIGTIDLLKMDIEGAECGIFGSDCHRWLPKTKIIVIELHDWLEEGCSAAFFNAISKYKIRTKVHEGMLVVEMNQNLCVG